MSKDVGASSGPGSREPDPQAVPASIPRAAPSIMLCRVARAMATAMGGDPDAVENGIVNWQFVLPVARAAIVAMRCPTARMVAATLPRTINPTEEQKALGAMGLARIGELEPIGVMLAGELVRDWQGMVDEALAESQ